MNLHTIREITYGTIFFRLFLSIVIGGVLGLERGRKSRPAGLRTYILVCLGSTVVMMTNQYVSQCMNTGDPVRMGAQVLSGIGFIGAGSIMKTGRNQVRGITTAAGLWAAACIGLTIGILLFSQIAFELNYEKCYPEADRLVLVRGGGENVKTGEKGEGYDDSLFAPMAEAFRSDLSQWIENATVIFNFETLNVFKDGHKLKDVKIAIINK